LKVAPEIHTDTTFPVGCKLGIFKIAFLNAGYMISEIDGFLIELPSIKASSSGKAILLLFPFLEFEMGTET